MMLDSIITTATSVVLTTLGAIALTKINKYIKEKERRELKKEAQSMMRLSSMTLPHAMARVILVEQLYRAWTILQGHPYHRV